MTVEPNRLLMTTEDKGHRQAMSVRPVDRGQGLFSVQRASLVARRCGDCEEHVGRIAGSSGTKEIVVSAHAKGWTFPNTNVGSGQTSGVRLVVFRCRGQGLSGKGSETRKFNRCQQRVFND